VQSFNSPREAKEFLISRILSESEFETVPLTEIERKMLYFSESAWTPPDIDRISASFDRDYDQTQYEEKIGTLVRNLCAKDRKDNQTAFEAWNRAVKTLRQEDHYLLVLIDTPQNAQAASWSRFLKRVAIGFAIACVVSIAGYVLMRLRS
jgi:hypothetical protein